MENIQKSFFFFFYFFFFFLFLFSPCTLFLLTPFRTCSFPSFVGPIVQRWRLTFDLIVLFSSLRISYLGFWCEFAYSVIFNVFFSCLLCGTGRSTCRETSLPYFFVSWKRCLLLLWFLNFLFFSHMHLNYFWSICFPVERFGVFEKLNTDTSRQRMWLVDKSNRA